MRQDITNKSPLDKTDGKEPRNRDTHSHIQESHKITKTESHNTYTNYLQSKKKREKIYSHIYIKLKLKVIK